MNDAEGLDRAEELVLAPLEDSPQPLWKLGSGRWSSRQQMVAFLGPGLVSLVARSLIEVRRFDSWPAHWKQGTPVVGDDLLRASGCVEAWSGNSDLGVLAAHITKAGIRHL